MKAEISTAEFEMQQLFFSTMFKDSEDSSRTLLFEDIDKLKTWQEYKEEMKTYHIASCSHLLKDVNGVDWAIFPRTGICYLYSL